MRNLVCPRDPPSVPSKQPLASWADGGEPRFTINSCAGKKRFSELKRAIPGITQRTLSQQLRDLQAAGIIDRTVHPDTPPRVVYCTTELGESLRLLLETMCHWGKSNSAAMALKNLRASDR
jgi:DNA-binding HxlR family transcriptional regulator